MANTKITALTSATTPLAGTEVLPVVQSSATVKVAVSDLTAGRSVSMASATISASNLTFSSTAQRITGDFSNATQTNRVAFQTTTVNGNTVVTAIPNGTSVISQMALFGGSDILNAQRATFDVRGGTEIRLASDFLGTPATGTYLPMVFYVAGSQRVKIDTSGNTLVTSAAGLGYGTGSGGTVTQATSKSTGVTLNKPTGQITMNNAALLPATTVVFTVTNSVCAFTDTVLMNHRNGADYNVWVVPGVGSFDVYLKNISVGSLSDAVTLNFAIIKGATS
jgi:hypothetical protein